LQSKPVRLAVIGLGMAAKPHLEALVQLGDRVKVSGVHNRSRGQAEHVAGQYGYRIFETIGDIAEDRETDGVILLTPPNQRRNIISLLAGAGKHILCEKPVERSTKAARELVEICAANGVLFGIVFQHRFRAGSKRLAELLRAGSLGKLALVRVDIPWWRDQAYYDVPGRGTYGRDGGGVLISQGIHVLDLMLSLTGPAKTVQAFCATTAVHTMESEDFATGGIRFQSGAVGSVTATTATFPGYSEKIVIDGTLGTATLEAGHLTVSWRDGRREELGEISATGGGADPMAFPCDWHRDLIADFAAAIRDDGKPMITGREALAVHALIDAMVASSRDGRETAIAAMED